MLTTVINPRGHYHDGEFSRCEEYVLIVTLGAARVAGELDEDYSEGAEIAWRTLRRSGLTSARGTSKGGKRQFYPLYVNDEESRIVGIGKPLQHNLPRDQAPNRRGCTAVFRVRDDGT
jgi:adenine-specific DNA-methyltransferase